MHIKFEEELQRIIAQRAHELSEHGNGNREDGLSDWLIAEREIMQELDFRSSNLFENSEITPV